MNAQELAPFKELIRTRCGLKLEGTGEEPLVIAIRKRMNVAGLHGAQAYLSLLAAREDEFQEFVTLLTINETYFFREPEQISLLTDVLMPRLLADPGCKLPIRILSAGCSSGEEPYSIAIALLERFGDGAAGMVRIHGGDLDHYALAKARAGRYTAFSFRSLDPILRDRYFHPSGHNASVVDERVKSMVSFHHLNLLAHDFPPGLQDLDVVFFRNVSIYFDEPTRRSIQESFRRAMSERGHLVIGSAETLANDLGVFRLEQEGSAFYFTSREKSVRPVAIPVPVSSPHKARLDPRPPVPARPPVAISPPIPTAPMLDREEMVRLIRDKKLDQAEAALMARNTQAPPDAGLLALQGYVRLLARDFAGAAELGEKALTADEWSVDSLMLLGLAAKWTDAADMALSWFKKAVYVRHECWPAQYYLAELLRASGAVDQARRGYRVVLQHLGSHPDPDGGLLLPLGLPLNEIRFLCERQTGSGQTGSGQNGPGQNGRR